MASNLSNLDASTLSTNSTATTTKSLYIGSYGSPGVPTIAIFGGGDSTILSNPLGNLSKLFFHSSFDYLRVRSAVSFTVSLPARNVRTASGGKKGGSSYNSYNGWTDWVIYQHNYGSPPPAFSMYLNSATSTGGTLLSSGAAIAGSVPIQYLSNNSFRLGVVYSTDKYLILRERYQVYQNSMPAVSMNCTAYFYNNPTSVNASSALAILHSPVTFNDTDPYVLNHGRGRIYNTSVTFTAQQGQSFNKVEVLRFGGGPATSYGNPFAITSINGTAVTAYDPYQAYAGGPTYTYGTQQTSWSMGIRVTDIPHTDAIGKNKYVYYTPRYAVRFTNTATGQTFTDSWGGVISFYIAA